MTYIQPGVAETMVEGVIFVSVFPGGNRGRNFVQSFRIEAQRLSHFPRSQPATVSNNVRGHGRATLAVKFVQILDYALTLIPAGKIEIDVWPLAALLRKKTFKKQIHAHRIHRGNAQRIANCTVRSRAPSLNQNALFAAETDQVPHNKEVASKVQLFYERQFAFNLAPGTLAYVSVGATVMLLRAFLGSLAQKRHHALAFRHGIFGELVSQIVERELKPGR